MRLWKIGSQTSGRRKNSSAAWLLTATVAAVAANACVVPEFRSDGRSDGSGGLGGDGTDQSAGTGGAPSGGSGGTNSGGSSGAAQGDGGSQGDGGGSQGDGGGSTGGSATGGSDTGGSGSGGEASGGSGSGGDSGVGEGPSDLPAPPGPDDVPKPDGTPGDITILNWAGFPAAVTYSFDDNDVSQLDYYLDLHALGGRYTFFLVSSGFGVPIDDVRWQNVHSQGHEIGNHTANHTCAAGQVESGQNDLAAHFGSPTTFAAPSGSTACQPEAEEFVFLNRSTGPAEPILPLGTEDPFALNCYIPATNQAASIYNANIDEALSQNGWVIYVIHGITPSSAFQPVSWNGLEAAITYAKDHDVWIDTLENAGAYWLGQKVFDAAMTEASGSSTTWTWVLPEHFPSGKYLRATVDGGTLTQNGQPLIWDPHGYYEIPLDGLSVTLEP